MLHGNYFSGYSSGISVQDYSIVFFQAISLKPKEVFKLYLSLLAIEEKGEREALLIIKGF